MRWWKRPRIFLLLFMLVILAVGNLCLAWAARRMHPAPPGRAEEFWDAMYHLDLSPRRYLRGVHPPREGVCIYYISGFHGQSVRRLPTAEARRLLPLVRNWAPEECPDLTVRERHLLLTDGDVPELVDAHLSSLLDEAEGELLDYRMECAKGFEEQWRRIRRYSTNILFEAIFLNSFVLFVFSPLVLRRPSIWAAASWGSALPLFLLPYYLGYAPWSFTSAAPVGGALYPLLILPFRWGWGWTGADVGLVKALGYPLEPWSQLPGPMMSVSGLGSMAPSFALFIGALIAIPLFIISRAESLRLRRKAS